MPLYALFFFSGKGNMRNNIYSYLVSMRFGGGRGGRYGDFEVVSNMKRVRKFLKKKILFEKTKRPGNVICLFV